LVVKELYSVVDGCKFNSKDVLEARESCRKIDIFSLVVNTIFNGFALPGIIIEWFWGNKGAIYVITILGGGNLRGEMKA
jgi:hypothetical protein